MESSNELLVSSSLTLSESSPNEYTENLLPFYFEPTGIVLFYDVQKMEVVIFFKDKYGGETTHSGKDIVSTIVKVVFSCNTNSYSVVPTYLHEYMLDGRLHLEINKRIRIQIR